MLRELNGSMATRPSASLTQTQQPAVNGTELPEDDSEEVTFDVKTEGGLGGMYMYGVSVVVYPLRDGCRKKEGGREKRKEREMGEERKRDEGGRWKKGEEKRKCKGGERSEWRREVGYVRRERKK